MSDAENQPSPVAGLCFICRCEEIEEDEILQAIAEGAQSVNDVKRRTRAGMGVCQGAYCVHTVAKLIARELGVPVEQIVPMTARPPVRLVPLAALASFDDE
ncbi:MAG: (2Fe-2S)-binding protein [Thermomicrobiales bacterium]